MKMSARAFVLLKAVRKQCVEIDPRTSLTSNDLKRFPPHLHESMAAKETAKLLTVSTSESIVVAANPVNTRSQVLSTNFGKFPLTTSVTLITSYLGSISSTFYVQLLRPQIPKE